MSRALLGVLVVGIGLFALGLRPALGGEDVPGAGQPGAGKVPAATVKRGIADDKLEWEQGAFGGLCRRSWLAKRGFTYSINSAMNAQYNASGGIRTGAAVANRLVAFLNFELGALTHQRALADSSIRVSAAWHAGKDINEFTGTFFKPDTNFLDPQVRLFELYWSQYFASRQVGLHIGRVAFGPMEFAMTPLLYDQLSAAFSSNPGAMFADQPVATFSESVSTWGARVLIEPDCSNFSVRLGVYNGWPRDQGRTDAHGVDWSLNLDKSTFVACELAYKLNQRPDDTGLRGNYKVGVLHDTGPFDPLVSSGATVHGNTGYYFIFDQMLYSKRAPVVLDKKHPSNWRVGRRWSHPTDEGIYVWGAAVAHPDDSINLFPYWLTGSVHYKGPFPGRHADRVGIGYRYGFTSGDLSLTDESSLEAFYHVQINTWLRVSPNAQYIWNPSGVVNSDALVVGFQVGLDL